MRHLNYNHLLYFWTVAKEGSIARASEVLHLTPQTISGQLKQLEQAVGEPVDRGGDRAGDQAPLGRRVDGGRARAPYGSWRRLSFEIST